MFEYIRPNQTSDPKTGTPRCVIQKRAISAKNTCADRKSKTGYCPRPEMEGIIQRCKKCKTCHKDLSLCDCPFSLRSRKKQYLDPGELRENLDAVGKGGEAHHLFSGGVVKTKKLANKHNKNEFNQSWNGILLNGSEVDGTVINPLNYDNGPNICHRKDNKPGHPVYDKNLMEYIDKNKIKTISECKKHSGPLMAALSKSNASCLDNFDFSEIELLDITNKT